MSSNTYYNKEAFLFAIEQYVKYCERPKANVFILKNIPKIYKDLGYLDVPFRLSTYVVDKSLKNKHKGEFTRKQFFRTLESLFDPLFIFKSREDSQSKGRSKIIFSDIIASKTELHAITFYPNSEDTYDNCKRKNIITSIHKRNIISKNNVNLIEQEISNGNCEYINDQKFEKIKKSITRFHT